MKLFRCEIEVQGWGTVYSEDRVHILAEDEESARQIYCLQNGFRKNKKGMKIREIPLEHSEVFSETRTELIHSTDYRPGLGTFDDSHYGKVTRHYCSKCKKEVFASNTFCSCCGANLIKGKKFKEEKI